MPTALFTNEADATAYRDACNVADGLPKPGQPEAPFPFGWTVSWADVVLRDGAWPIPVHATVPPPDGVIVVPDPEVM